MSSMPVTADTRTAIRFCDLALEIHDAVQDGDPASARRACGLRPVPAGARLQRGAHLCI